MTGEQEKDYYTDSGLVNDYLAYGDRLNKKCSLENVSTKSRNTALVAYRRGRGLSLPR